MEVNGNKLVASKGCVLRRKADGTLFGSTVYLGYVYRINGKKLVTPYLEDEDNYEEVFQILFEGNTLYMVKTNYDDLLNLLIRYKYTQAQEFALLRNRDTDSDEYSEYIEYCKLCRLCIRNLGYYSAIDLGKTELELAIEDKLQEITDYDNSSNVNLFYLCGKPMWLVKADRVGLMNSTLLLKTAGLETTTIWHDYVEYTFSCDAVLQMLGVIERYALECYNVTLKHKAAVVKLTTVEEVKAYDYTVGYPNKVNL